MKPKRLISILFVVFVFLSGCQTAENNVRLNKAKQADYITIASFNIQIFGKNKIENQKIMEVLARIISRYDIVAIQEVRSTKQNIIPELLKYVNREGRQYSYVISKRLGRTGSKEQYAFVYNTKTITLIPDSAYVIDDPEDIFEREPFVAYFRSGNFDFKVVDNHIKPEDALAELKHLSIAINDIYDNSPEKDIVVVGDMNADGDYLDENQPPVILPLWVQLIRNNEDTTVATNNYTYDRMMTRENTANREYTGNAGVFRWDKEYKETDSDFVKKVSDHYPVYAVFRTDLPDDD